MNHIATAMDRPDPLSFMFGPKLIAMNEHWDRAADAALARDDEAFEKHMAAFWQLAGGRNSNQEDRVTAKEAARVNNGN